ncbi:MAG TPA: AI-2E family transporter [Kofleriaceae bacterium]|nr:AI-2E family transporter [Kofleriaceae bacterium]
MAPPEPKDDRRVTRIEIAPKTIFLVLLAILGVWVAQALWNVVVVILVALIMVGAVLPIVHFFERHGVKRSIALALIYIGAFLIITGLLFLTLPPLVSQLLEILENAPKERQKLVAFLSDYKVLKPIAQSLKTLPLDQVVTSSAQKLLGYSSYVLTAIGYAVTTMFLSIYLIADAKRVNGALYAVVPRAYHLRLARILLNLETIVGGYIRGQLITSLAITIFTFVLLTGLGVPDSLALAIFAGLTDVIPFIGGVLASGPAVIASIGQGAPVAIIVVIAMIIYQEFESRILVPRLYGRVLRMSSALVVVALLIGGTLMGILGALLALPVAAGLQMIVREMRVELPGEDVDDTKQRARDQRAEQVYEQLSAGAPATEAAQIAGDLAVKIRENEHHGRTITDVLPTLDRDRPGTED